MTLMGGDGKLRPATAKALTAAGIALLLIWLVPTGAAAMHDRFGGATPAHERTLEALPYTELPAGYEFAADADMRTATGRHLLSDDPCGCTEANDYQVVRDGVCYQVPR